MTANKLPARLRRLYFPAPGTPSVVEVPAMNYLMVDGAGDPNTATAFREAIGALYGLAYTIKFGSAEPAVRRAPVMPLEGRFWSARGSLLGKRSKRDWRWTLLLREPEGIGSAEVELARRTLRSRKDPPGLAKVRFERWKEGKAVEVLHVGPYSAEAATVRSLHRFARSRGYRLTGRHHEIYLGDPRRTRPERLKTVIRQPVLRVAGPRSPPQRGSRARGRPDRHAGAPVHRISGATGGRARPAVRPKAGSR